MRNNNKYDLGIIGGMGSEATAQIFNRIIQRTKHDNDQDFMRICVLNDSKIPDRTKAILEGGDSPTPFLKSDIRKLKKIGAKYLIIPCNTAHYFMKDVNTKGIKFIDMIDEALHHVKEKHKNKAICLLATTGTVESGVYFNRTNLVFIKLEKEDQNEVMNVIINTKEKGVSEESLNVLKKAIDKVLEKNDKEEVVFLIGCTELSLYANELKNYNIVDAMDVLVSKAILSCGYELK